MAPVDASAYMPPLDQCLDGKKQLLSWRLAFTGLAESSPGVGYKAISAFIRSADTVEILVNSTKSQSGLPTSKKADFDKYTSAINITQNGNGSYDLHQLKDDALWLSKEAKLDEVSALRIVVLEWQYRPRARLFHDNGSEEIPEFSGSTRLKTSLLLSRIRSPPKTTSELEKFDSQESRRFRILNIFLSERRFQYRTLGHIIFRTLCERRADEGSAEALVDAWKATEMWSFLAESGDQILNSWKVNDFQSSRKTHWLVDIISLISEKLDGIAAGSQMQVDDTVREELEMNWCESLATGVVHLMHTIFIVAQSSESLFTAESVSMWFILMDKFGFFANFELPFEILQEGYIYDIRCLATLVSLAIINIPVALESIPSLSSGAPTDTNPQTAVYLQDISCIEQITMILLNGAANRLAGVQPVALAWSIILQDARSYSDTSQLARDSRQAQRAAENITSSAVSDTESLDGVGERRRPSPNRRTSFGSDNSGQLTYLEEVADVLQKIEPADDVINLLARLAFQEPGAFEVMTELALQFSSSFGSGRHGLFGVHFRKLLLDILTVSLGPIKYQPDLVSTALAILSGGASYWDTLPKDSKPLGFDIASYFLQINELRGHIFETALARFPFESLPFIKLCQALTTSPMSSEQKIVPIKAFLDNIQSLTSIFYEENTAYQLKGEGENMYIVLDSPLDVMASSRSLSQSQARLLALPSSATDTASTEAIVLPSGTPGRTLTDSKPLVVMFRYPYSGLKYMGLVLGQALEARSTSHADLNESKLEIATEIVSLLSRMLVTASMSIQNGNSREEAQSAACNVLEEASVGLGRNQDIVSVILEMFEDELYDQKAGTSSGSATDLLVCCVEFMNSLLFVLPGRVWPFLGRSGLLGLKGAESRLIHAVATLEVPASHFPFLLSTAHLFESIVDDAMTHSMARMGNNTTTNRFGTSSPDSSGSGITETLMRKIILHYEKIMIDIFESTNNWRFIDIQQRMEINTTICRTFDKIIAYSYENDDELDLNKKLSSALAPSAEYLLDVFLSSLSNELPIQPLTQAILEGVSASVDAVPIKVSHSRVIFTEMVIRYTCRLVRTNTYLNRSLSKLQSQLFSFTPAIARCFAAHERYKLPVIELLDALIRGYNKSTDQPPSLLGHLGQEVAKSFVDLLSHLDAPLDNRYLAQSIWKLLSGVVSERQQWFAIYILTGTTPKESLRHKGDNSGSVSSHLVFDLALSKLKKIPQVDFSEIIPVLEFLSQAADFWPRVCEVIRNDSALIKTFRDFILRLGTPDRERSSSDPDFEARRIQAAALVINILAIVTHRCNEVQDTSFAKELLPYLDFLIQGGASTPDYNTSLHSRLRKNFESKYPPCRLSQFKKTSLAQTNLGTDFYYDIDMANKVLRHDPAWSPHGHKGFFNEFVLANRNLSLVEAQMNLFHAWKTLAVELSLGIKISGSFQKSVASVIRDCLAANAKATLSELIFSRLVQSRASLAFILLQQLIESAKASNDAQSVLKPAWETFRAATSDLGSGLSGSDSEYVRTLLKIVYLSLQAHATTSKHSDSGLKQNLQNVVSIVLDILKVCAASGFRSIIGVLHDDISKVLPSDFALINGILRTSLRIPGVNRHTEQLQAMFADENSALYASTLLSWAHHLTIDKDPVFGEISLTFLAEMSSVPVLSECIVTSGTLGQVASAELMNYLRRPGGCGPFDEPARMYSIWSRTVLPLAINLLTYIGAPISGDIGSFINQFGSQLDRASISLATKQSGDTGSTANRIGLITLTMASEIHSLAMISTVLGMFREAGASAGIASTEVPELAWDRALIKSDLETRLQRRTALRDDIVPTDEREETLSKQKPLNAKAGFQSRLEERVVGELSAALALLGEGEN